MYGKLTLCEFARIIKNGSQFDALGAGIKEITINQFPATIAFSLLIDANFTQAETGKEYPFEIKIIDSENKAAGPTLGGSISVNKNQRGPLYAAFNIQFVAKKPLTINYSLLINGEEKDTISLDLKTDAVPVMTV
jgi:hypothetical protein